MNGTSELADEQTSEQTNEQTDEQVSVISFGLSVVLDHSAVVGFFSHVKDEEQR